MRIEISPIDGPADQVPAIRVTDASADQEVSLTVSTRDAKAQSWASRSAFGRTQRAPSIRAATPHAWQTMRASIRAGRFGRCSSPVAISPRRCLRRRPFSWS